MHLARTTARLACFFLATLLCGCNSTPTDKAMAELKLSKECNLTPRKQKSPAVTCLTNNRIKRFDLSKPAQLLFKKSDEFVAVPRIDADASQHLLLILRERSRPETPMGFCGAGHEDSLVLLTITEGVVTIADKLLIQSCLHSINLTQFQGDTPNLLSPSVPGPYAAQLESTSCGARANISYLIGVHDQRLEVSQFRTKREDATTSNRGTFDSADGDMHPRRSASSDIPKKLCANDDSLWMH